MANITLFAQAISKLPKEIIREIIREAKTDKHCKGYDIWSQFISIMFCQFISIMFCQFSGCDSVCDKLFSTIPSRYVTSILLSDSVLSCE